MTGKPWTACEGSSQVPLDVTYIGKTDIPDRGTCPVCGRRGVIPYGQYPPFAVARHKPVNQEGEE